MAKNRDFLDYLSLGNQLVQTSRLGGVERAQAALVALHAEQVRTDQRNEDARVQEDQIREFVFGCSKWLHGLEAKFGKSKPVGTLALLYDLQQKIEDQRISTARVRSYEDKEKVHAFLENVKRAVADCEARLDAESIEQAARCAKYKAEENCLTAVIEHEKKQVELENRQEELMKLGTPGMAHFIPAPLSLPMLLIGAIMVVIVANPEDVHRPAPASTVAIAWLLAVLGFVGILPKGKNQAQAYKEALDADLQDAESEAELIVDIRKDFGDGDLEFYQTLLAERHAFIEKILGNGEGETAATETD
jgi:hypothetical protein